MTFPFRISGNIEKAKRRKEDPRGFQSSRWSRIDQKDVHLILDFRFQNYFFNLQSTISNLQLMGWGSAIAFAEVAPASHHLMIDQKLDHFTLIPTLTTFKSPCGTGPSRKVESPKSSFRRFGLLHQFGNTNSTHHIEMSWNDERDLYFFFKRSLDTSIRCDSSLEDNGRKDLFPPADIIQIILHQGVTETSHNVFYGVSNLLFMNHVRFSKNRTSACDPNRLIRF